MKVFVPAGVREVQEKAEWFKKPICQVLRGKKGKFIDFGFQIQGSVKGLRELNISFPFGVHLHKNLATEWQDKRKRREHLEELEMVARLPKLLFAVLHGIRVNSLTASEKLAEKRYLSQVEAGEWLNCFEKNVEFVRFLQKMGIPVYQENNPIIDYLVDKKGVPQPETKLALTIGVFSRDLIEIRRRTGCRILLDLEHLAFTLNFAERESQYNSLPIRIPETLSKKEDLLLEKYGIFLRRGLAPVFPEIGSLEEEIKKIGPRVYHLNGTPNGNFIEVFDRKLADHQPIEKEDETFRRYLRMLLSLGPEILVLETATLKDLGYESRGENDQEKSFENLCQILAEKI